MSAGPAPGGYARMPSPLGDILLLARAGRLAGLYFVGQRDDPGPGEAIALADLPIDELAELALPGVTGTQSDRLASGLADRRLLAQARSQVDAYFAGELCSFDLPLDLAGTPFQKAVWQALLTIPFGTTTSYGDIAARCGLPAAARAVGRAVGSNPVSIVVPCHRVIGRDGSLTGFGGGLDRKRGLLALEAGEAPLFCVPAV